MLAVLAVLVTAGACLWYSRTKASESGLKWPSSAGAHCRCTQNHSLTQFRTCCSRRTVTSALRLCPPLSPPHCPHLPPSLRRDMRPLSAHSSQLYAAFVRCSQCLFLTALSSVHSLTHSLTLQPPRRKTTTRRLRSPPLWQSLLGRLPLTTTTCDGGVTLAAVKVCVSLTLSLSLPVSFPLQYSPFRFSAPQTYLDRRQCTLGTLHHQGRRSRRHTARRL